MTLHCAHLPAPQLGSVTDSDNDFARILAAFPDVVKPHFHSAMPKHGVLHHIPTTGPPLYARPRRLPPDKLAQAKEEFRKMEEMGIVRIDYKALAEAQKEDEEMAAYRTAISGLVLEDVRFGPGESTLLCDVSTHHPRPIIPATWRRRIFDTVHGLTHLSIRATKTMIAAKDAIRSPLAKPYEGPFRVLQRQPKTFIIDYGGRHEAVSVDHLEPAYIDLDTPVQVARPRRRGRPTSQQKLPPPPSRVTRSGSRKSTNLLNYGSGGGVMWRHEHRTVVSNYRNCFAGLLTFDSC
ncbi:hypothetical protein Pcinc_003143 [Petrolisthes cinctipes]|uniref:Uncharacterized protein n=1 Tax=Petrolisthes cinctipes TaxID=88211 RepID=A0AAE1GH49_PETCI|nr:hypothetical protein Pcinc_003143 [Petrolisthes cinctipes]